MIQNSAMPRHPQRSHAKTRRNSPNKLPAIEPYKSGEHTDSVLAPGRAAAKRSARIVPLPTSHPTLLGCFHAKSVHMHTIERGGCYTVLPTAFTASTISPDLCFTPRHRPQKVGLLRWEASASRRFGLG